MSAAPDRRWSIAEYLTFERAADHRHELLEGEIFAMAGGSREHNVVKDNLAIALGTTLDGGPCRPFISDQRVRIPNSPSYTYPDIAIVCGTPEYDPADRDTLLNPIVIVEVLSESTERYDRSGKFRLYQRIPSLREYVLVAQDEPLIERFVRQANGDWLPTSVIDLSGSYASEVLNVTIPLARIYRGVDFTRV